MSRKSKGISAERELIHLFWAEKIPCIRVAGSGAIKYPCPDILAGTPEMKAAIECKVTKDKTQYFTQEEIQELAQFAFLFGADPYIAVKFNRQGWVFLPVDKLEKTEKCYVVKSDQKSLTFENFAARFRIFISQ